MVVWLTYEEACMRRVRGRGWRVAVAALWLCAACGDDGVALTEGGTGTSGGTTTDEPPTTTVTPTTDTSTTDTSTTTVPTTTDSSTTMPVTTGDTTTTSDTTTGDTTTGDTTTGDTTTGGVEVVGKSVTQTVNGGTVASSTNFRMVFTLGQPTASQGTYNSANFRLQGGLVGANGSPP